ncbi:Emopamil binding protein-domain-containing protein [Russula dissimulans]|nr:Emopamil binding protein-domain-containing protein [Russula dissimulans]
MFTFEHTVNTSSGLFAAICMFFVHSISNSSPHTSVLESLPRLGREYVKADSRWGTADPTIVSLELVTVFIAAPLELLVVYQIVKQDRARYYWIVVVSAIELYGNPHLNTSNLFYFWVYLVFSNGIFAVMDVWLLHYSYEHIADPLRSVQAGKLDKAK